MSTFVGIQEIADRFGVSKQRAHQLAHRSDFPEPLVRLACGPIWTRGAIERFNDGWERKGGRRKKAA